jgi:hypothetical protein
VIDFDYDSEQILEIIPYIPQLEVLDMYPISTRGPSSLLLSIISASFSMSLQSLRMSVTEKSLPGIGCIRSLRQLRVLILRFMVRGAKPWPTPKTVPWRLFFLESLSWIDEYQTRTNEDISFLNRCSFGNIKYMKFNIPSLLVEDAHAVLSFLNREQWLDTCSFPHTYGDYVLQVVSSLKVRRLDFFVDKAFTNLPTSVQEVRVCVDLEDGHHIRNLKYFLDFLSRGKTNVRDVHLAFYTSSEHGRFYWRTDVNRPAEVTALLPDLLAASIELEARGIKLIDEEGRSLTSSMR